MPQTVVTLTLEQARELISRMHVEPSYTLEDVAAHCQVTPQCVYNWVRAGRLKAVQPAGGRGRIYVTKDDLRAFELANYLKTTGEEDSASDRDETKAPDEEQPARVNHNCKYVKGH